ncbi:MAG TPA: regulatory protein RecX [Rhodoglobus sp.]|nr:regulatory protein RecX [Rhodoglobus sp.]
MSSSGATPSDTVEPLAPVTWLFGEPPIAVAPEELPSPHSAEVAQQQDAVQRGGFDPINNVSMNALARRGMSIAEMRDYLIGREFEGDEVELELERLIGVALLDDEHLAATLVRTLRERKGLGRSALTAELRRRKLEPAAVESALDDLETGDELERATEIALRRAPQLRSLDQATAKRRLGAFLMRKGYSGSVVSAAVAAALTPSGPVFR